MLYKKNDDGSLEKVDGDVDADAIDVSALRRILTNPIYAIKVSEEFTIEKPPLVSESNFIKAGAKLIEEIGAEQYLYELLENLKGNYK